VLDLNLQDIIAVQPYSRKTGFQCCAFFRVLALVFVFLLRSCRTSKDRAHWTGSMLTRNGLGSPENGNRTLTMPRQLRVRRLYIAAMENAL
jgi:hypothetical protein